MKKIYKILAFSLIIFCGWNTNAFAQFYTFSYTGGSQSWTVPPGILTINVFAQGGAGGLNSDPSGHTDSPGHGGCAYATFAVTPGQVITINTGGKGGNGVTSVAGAGGFNGGGIGGVLTSAVPHYAGGGGGGASDIRFGATRMLIAAGGGGSGLLCGGFSDNGGDGGYTAGNAGAASCPPLPVTTAAGGGTSTIPGIGGTCVSCLGAPGSSGSGFTGGAAGTGSPGGGGGAGLWGGGGGQYTGGGGGSSYADPSATAPSFSNGCNTVNGVVMFTAVCTPGTVTPSTASAICEGSTLTVSDPIAGGTWTSSNTAVATVGTSSGIVTGVYGGTAIITYNIGPCFATTTVSINATPSVIPAFALCAGQTTTLSDSISGGTWMSANTTVATVDPTLGIVLAKTAGVTTIKYTATTGCFTITTITVNPLPNPIGGPDSVCLGGTTTLSDAGGGTWTSSNTAVATIGTSGVVSGVTLGTTTITYTLTATGCLITTSLAVNPYPTAIIGPDTLCNGATITLSDATAGGKWTSVPAFVAAIGSSSGVVTGLSSGTSTICYTLFMGGCSSCMPVTVDPTPTVILGQYHVCPGNTTTLSDGVAGGIWTSNNTTIATIDPTLGTVTGGTTGTTTITYTLVTGGCSITHSFTVDVTPGAITGVPVVCAGSTTSLTDAPGGGTWTSSATTIATVGTSSGIVTGKGLAGGTATITYTTIAGCQAFVVVTVNPLSPVTGPNSVCVGNVIVLSDVTTGGGWSSSNSGVATVDPTGNVFGVSAGVANICYTTGLGCTACMTITVNPTPTIIGSSNICQGQTICLSDFPTGGTWTSSSTTVAVIGSSSGCVTGITTGTTTITYALGTGCFTTIVATVNTLPSAITGTFTVCQGLTTCLSDVTPGGTWTTSSTAFAVVGSTGCVTGLSNGTATISYIMPTGCYAVATVTINPLPVGITGPNKVCVGSTITLSDGTAGGTWTSSNTTVATIGTSGVLFGSTVGSATVTYTLSSTGCITTYPVTVNPLPGPILGISSLCGAATITLSDAVFGGTWTASNTSASIGLFSGVLTGTAKGGVDTITYTTGSTGCLVTATVLINPLSPVTGGDSVCAGSSITLSDATFGGGGTWSSSNTGVATVGLITGTVTGLTAGTSTICYNLATGCKSCITFTVNPLPPFPTGSSAVCQTQTVTLSDGISGGTWTSSNTTLATVGTSSGIVTGVNYGSLFIIYTLPTGCNVVFPMVVKSLGPIKGTLSVCPGNSVTLSDSVTSGAWSSSNTNATIGSSTGIVTGVVTGTTTISYTTLDGCTATVTFTVNPLPGPILGSTTLCIGQTSILNCTPLTGTWSSSNTNNVTVTAGGLITGIAVPGAVITYTLPTGCINVIFVTVNPLPGIITSSTGALVVCQGSTITLSDSPAGGTWMSSLTTIATVGTSTGIVTGKAPGTTTITYTLATGCTATAVVTVNPIQPITGGLSACVGLTTSLTDAVGGGIWSSSNTGVATVGTTGVVTGISPGTSTICYTTPAGCSACVIVTIVALPTPIMGSTFVLCTGGTVTLSDGVGGGTWTSSITTVATIGTSGTISTVGVTGGTTTITYTVGSGCFVTQTITVNPVTPITPPPFQVCIGSSITLTDATGGGTWTSSNTGVATIDVFGNVNTVGVTGGTSVITYQISSSGCLATQVVTVNPLPAPITGPTQVCQFSSITLSDATPGGGWFDLTPAIIGVAGTLITGNLVGVGTVQYKLGTGCAVTYNVTVLPLPTVIIGTPNVCIGGTVTLSDATAGGTWISSNTNVATIGSTSGVITTGITGITTISYKLTATGCATSITFSVNPYPVAISGPTEVCGNATVTLSDPSGPGNWTSSNTLIATAVNTLPLYSGAITGVSGSGGGVVIISYTLNTGCGVAYTMTILPQPSAIITPLGDTNICKGSFVALTANTGIGLLYQWYAGGVAIGGATNSSYIASPLINTSYTVYVSSGLSGCAATSIPMLVSIIPVPAAIYTISSPTFCTGGSVKIHANIGVGLSYQWVNVAVGVISGATDSTYTTSTAGAYEVVVSNSTGCSDTSNIITVVINPLPLGTLTHGPLSICNGDSVIFRTDAGNTYVWFKGGIAIGGATVDSYIVKTSGAYKVTETTGFGCSATSATFTVTVNALPPVPGVFNPKPNVFCAGSSTTLSITGAILGETFQWYDNGIAISGASSSTLLVASSGRYQAMVTTTLGLCSAISKMDTIVVVPTPTVIIPTSSRFCWGGSSELIVSVIGGTGPITYQWAKGGIPIPGATNAIYYATTGGTYGCLVSVPASCSISSSTVSVIENPLPNPLITFDGASLHTENYFVSYQWYKGLAAIFGATTSSTPATGNDDYKVAVTDTNGCQSVSDKYVLTGWTANHGVGVQNVNGTDIRIYPNPAQTVVHIESPGEVRAVINAIDGRKIMEQTAAKDIDISRMANGIYTITLYDSNGLVVKKEKLVKAAN